MPSDPEKLRLEEAAQLVQAAFRGYLARRAFKALKGIIRLQALIRGHLVRRQAVVTLCCVMGIIKLQALARGRKIRSSDIGQEIYKKCVHVKTKDSKLVNSYGVSLSIQISKMSGNAFVRKLLVSSPTVMPLRLYYDSMEPNSVPSWLGRWSASNFWKPVPQPKKLPYAKLQRKHGNGQMVDAETGRPKRSVRRVTATNVDNNLVQAASEFEKPKRNFRKVSSQPVDTAQESPQNELEKVKRNLRKVHNPIMENSVQSEVEIEKQKPSMEKVSRAAGDNISGQSMSNSAEKLRKESTLVTSKQADLAENMPTLATLDLPNVHTIPEPLESNETSEEPQCGEAFFESKPSVESGGKDEDGPVTNGDLGHKEDPNSDENQKSGRKTSSASKQEHTENGLQSSPMLPSYMATTESAKAKLRLQGSPRFSQNGSEKNNITRRHSLPSSATSKVSSQSPRTQRAVNSGTKVGNKSDRSLLASRDGNAKGIQLEWRR
uniref:Calmodulin binding protein n=1 Tax=Rhizophora mucronata TaxID=61149 RepID=A0A2P2LWQ1_RHIMU